MQIHTPPRSPLLGCIADDLTGATDLAGGLVREGLRVTLAVGTPRDDPDEHGTPPADDRGDAIVVALKSRSIPARDATALSREALRWLHSRGIERTYFKYASTFDSTPAGNIGPVTEALQHELGVTTTVACPAFPANGRTVYAGHLFLGSSLVSETHMRNHPLNPMTDPDLRRVLAAQVTATVGHLPHATVKAGPGAIRAALRELIVSDVAHVIADAIDDDDLRALGEALVDEALVTGGSALGAAIGVALRDRGAVEPAVPPEPPSHVGRAAVIAGSCSTATLAQVEAMAARHPTFRVEAAAVARGDDVAGAALDWAAPLLDRGPVLVSSSAPPGSSERGDESIGPAIERTLAAIARGLVDRGVGRLVVAGGETSGAVVGALGLRLLEVGREIEPGVPWVLARQPVELGLVLKSGNFGSPSFFAIALGEAP